MKNWFFCLVILSFGILRFAGAEELPWKEFHAVSSGFKMDFPDSPKRINTLNGQLSYDAYISSANENSLFMLLVAKIPESALTGYGRMTLESFLGSLLAHKQGSDLLRADLILFKGTPAIDFFIRSAGQYFQGRATMVAGHLYLMAMECDLVKYNESHFNRFADSFNIIRMK